MSRSHPQNGPSLSKATYKKPKPLSDEELAEYQSKQRKREAEIIENSRSGRHFAEAVRANGGSIPLRGGNAKAFWNKIKRDSEAK